MPDQLRTTEGELYDRAFPPKDLAYWLGQVLQAPVQGMPTVEDYRREQGEIGVPTPEQSARESGQGTLDYVTQFLGPLMALMTSRQYARTKDGRTGGTWKDQAWHTKANSPLEAMRAWQQSKAWKDLPPEGESAWRYRNPPTIGGPTGLGMSKDEILAAIEKERFQGMLKQIRDTEAREATERIGRVSRTTSPVSAEDEVLQRALDSMRRQQANLDAGRPPRGRDDDLLEAALAQLKRQGRLPGARDEPDLPFALPPLPGD